MAMTKKLLTLSLAFFLIVSRQAVAYSYDFREDAMNDAEREIAETMEGNILFHSYNCTGEPSARPYSERLDWDLAKRVYQFTSQEFTSALTCGTLEDAIASAPSIWKVPVYYGDSDYAYANVGTSGNSPGYTTVYGNADTGNDAPYLFEPEIVPAGMFGREGSTYIVAVSDYGFGMNFVITLTEEEVRLVPYSTRPDFLKLENGMIYSSGEVVTALSELSGSMAWTGFGGGGGGLASNGAPAIIVITLLSAVLLILWVKRRGAPKNKA